MLELSTSNEDWSVYSSPHRWSADAEQDSYIPMSQRTIASSRCPEMHQKLNTLHMKWTSQSDAISIRRTCIYLTQEVGPWLLLRIVLLSWATSYFINSPPTWRWFSVNTEAVKHGLTCSSLHSWLCLQWHGFVLTSKIEQVIYLENTETRNDTLTLDVFGFNGQASNLQKWKHYMLSKICTTFSEQSKVCLLA